MSVRKTDYGPRPTTCRAAAIDLTREHLARQPMGAGFTTTPETRQWKCDDCGNVSPSSKSRCRACGEPRRERGR